MTDVRTRISDEQLTAFCSKHRLPPAFRETARQHFLPLAEKLPAFRCSPEPLLLGINGAQGTGKTTLAHFLALAAGKSFAWRTAVLSIDDFYLTRAERQALGRAIHPLLEIRGVPGTHDTQMLSSTLDRLATLPAGGRMRLPRFDKATDDRASESDWPFVTGPLDLIILEGWCVGSGSQPAQALEAPVNELERHEDPDATWRRYANDKLARDYAPVFSCLDALVFFTAPSFAAVLRWRLEQEHKLAQTSSTAGTAIMQQQEVARFIRFYERLTRHNLATLPEIADVVLTLDEDHAVVASRYRTAGGH